MGGETPPPIAEVLSYPIMLSDRILESVPESTFFKSECSEIGTQVQLLASILRSAVRFAATATTIYDRPARQIAATVSQTLFHALTLVRKCRRRRSTSRNLFIRVFNFVGAADFRKLHSLLDSSIADLRWLLTLFDPADGDYHCHHPSIAATISPAAILNPMLSWVWSSIASVQMGQLPLQIEAANLLASLAVDNDHNKNMIVEEGGVPPLLKLLAVATSPDAQIAASAALFHLMDSSPRVGVLVHHQAIPLLVQVLSDSSMRVQTRVAELIARIAQHDDDRHHGVKQLFATENVVRPLVSLLSFETFDEDDRPRLQWGRQHSADSLVRLESSKETGVAAKEIISRRQLGPRLSPLPSFYHHDGGGRGGIQLRKERQNETPEAKRELKVACAKALLMLAKDSVANSRMITETRGLLCLARLIEKEEGELRVNCLLAVMEIAAAAESDVALRRAAFKSNSPAAKAAVDQLLRIVKVCKDPSLQIPAIKSIGSLARTFPARESRVIQQLVALLRDKDQQVAMEAAVALGKFVSPENFLCREHSKTIVESNGILLLLKLLRENDTALLQVLILLCHLAAHAGSHEDFDQARRVLTTLEGAERTIVVQHPQLKLLIPQALNHLRMYYAGGQSRRLSYVT